MEDKSYVDYLLQLLENKEIKREFHNDFKLNLYLTLLSLNNDNYQEIIHTNEINIVEDYLRKVNNLKVKIQLKRKEIEIDNLLDEIKNIYDDNLDIISKYNKDNIDIINILNNKDAKEITNVIDKLTKVKISKIDKFDYHNNLRKKIISNIANNKYYLEDNSIYINDDIVLSIDEFYDIFDYLLNINNYKEMYPNKEIDIYHKDIIVNIINLINGNTIDKEIIPIILTYLSYNDIYNYEEIDTSKFNIENIKISDLYTFANNNDNNISNKTAKWRKVLIPNSYLYSKIKELTNKGMYYFKDNSFIFESIDKTISDFKISINIDDMITFIKDNLNSINNLNSKTKHI